MKAIVVKLSDFNNPNYKRLFGQIVNLSTSYHVCWESSLVYIYFDNDPTLTACSSSLFVASILHRVTLI